MNSLRDPVSEQAAYWFALLLDGSESDEDRRRFAEWIAQGPENPKAFAEIEHLWSGSSSLDFSASTQISRRALLGGSAAAVLLAAGWGAVRYHPLADIRTEIGQRREISIPGQRGRSIVASNSILSFVSEGGMTGVELHRGEAWFEHEAGDGTFFVHANTGKTISSGGTFDVAAYDGKVTTIAENNGLLIDVAGQRRALDEGNALTYHAGGVASPAHPVDVQSALAWRQGQLIFMAEPLEYVTTVLERWQPGKIMVIGEALKKRPVTLVVDLDRSRDVVPVLARVLHVDVARFTDYLTVIREV